MESTASTKSDWNEYYLRNSHAVPRFIVEALFHEYKNVLDKCIDSRKPLVIVELGGADSCFYNLFSQNFNVDEYHIIDNNKVGMALSEKGKPDNMYLHEDDLFKMDRSVFHPRADLVFSGGLIEHFEKDETQLCVQAHFDFALPGGLVMMSCPTPTIVYWSFRKLIEKTGHFPPLFERPLRLIEVGEAISQNGEILEHRIIWKTLLTQLLVVARKGTLNNFNHTEKNNNV